MGTRIEELRLMPYEEYLNTPEWTEKRTEALDRAKYRCQVCNSPDGLQVHHRTYENKGDERPEDLTVLCGKCHNLYHSSSFGDLRVSSIKNILESVFDALEKAHTLGFESETVGIPTGFVDIDKLTCGLKSSELIVIAGRPGAGKTSLALSIVLQAARRWQKRIALFSLEMSDKQLVQRLVSAETGIEVQRLWLGDIKEDEWPIFLQSTNLLSNASIFIDDTPAISTLELHAKARHLYAEHGLDLLVVDYLQLMRGSLRGENRYQEMSFISRFLKALARELNIPIIVVSQLSRQLESRFDKRPMLSDLKDTGTIEQEADVILFLYRDDMYNPDTEFPNIAEIIVAKNRNGLTGVFSVYFKKHLTQFVDLEIRRGTLED